MRDIKKDSDEIEKKLLDRVSQEAKFLDDASMPFTALLIPWNRSHYSWNLVRNKTILIILINVS